ncbi:hypothetical protein KC19_5G037900 [Ceratodon purpureus]|uniref:Secreted protein n=1 Tax=Ceratodon purpureus TaxID=3225 RepID=A0A8T0HYZ4_CERPU|nr:hypothetical protein KC19_5G037900 [Ceratodon purpureus]
MGPLLLHICCLGLPILAPLCKAFQILPAVQRQRGPRSLAAAQYTRLSIRLELIYLFILVQIDLELIFSESCTEMKSSPRRIFLSPRPAHFQKLADRVLADPRLFTTPLLQIHLSVRC